jgi:hypothetical protein
METIRNPRVHLAVAAIAVAAFTTTAVAHHSQSQFDTTQTITVEGTLTAASWVNPHSLFFVTGTAVTGNTATLKWECEGPNPRMLETAGWLKAETKIGDKVTVTGHPRRDGRPELLLTGVTLANGKKISFQPE